MSNSQGAMYELISTPHAHYNVFVSVYWWETTMYISPCRWEDQAVSLNRLNRLTISKLSVSSFMYSVEV